MKIVLPLYLILIFPLTSFGDDTSFAIQKTAEAISQTETGKEISRNLEREVFQIIPVEKDTAAIIGTTVVTAIQGKVDTKPIKNMDFNTLGGKVRPDIEYNFNSKDSEAVVKYIKNF